MHFHIFVMAMMALICSAAPSLSATQHSSPEKGFSLSVKRNRASRMKSPRRMMADTLAKYGKALPNNEVFRVSAEPGTVVADPTLYDQEYLASAYVGGQHLLVDIDTGSSDTWVFSTELPTSDQGNHSLYDPQKSSTAQLIPNATWTIGYGDGSEASGDVYTDCIMVGSTIVEKQAIEVAETVSPSFVGDASDGILGLGFEFLNTVRPKRQKTFMQNAVAQGLPAPVYTADLHAGEPGSYDFGFINKSKYSGDLFYADVDSSEGFWMVNMTGWSFGIGSNQTQSNGYSQISVVDTGTSIVYLSMNLVQGFWATVPQAVYSFEEGGYVFPCETQLPDFTVQIGEFNGTIPGQLLSYSPATMEPNSKQTCAIGSVSRTKNVANSRPVCYGGIQAQPQLGFNILGDVFLKTAFVVFDQGDSPRVGFAAKAT